jgi:hypothetical protein
MVGCHLCLDCLGQFRLVDVYKLCRVKNPFGWLCPRYRIDYGVDLTRRFLCMVIRVLVFIISGMHFIDHGISIYCFPLTR